MGPWELGWCTLGGGGVEVLRPCRTRFCGGSRVDGWQKNGEEKLLKAIRERLDPCRIRILQRHSKALAQVVPNNNLL